MNWIIDGYNVLFANDLGHDEGARESLLDAVRARFHGKGDTVTIVYDSRGSFGVQRGRSTGNVGEIFVGDADRYIVSRIRQSSRPRSFILVTDDVADIVSAVRPYRPRHVSSREFYAGLRRRANPPRPAPEKPDRESPDNIRRYLDLFGQG